RQGVRGGGGRGEAARRAIEEGDRAGPPDPGRDPEGDQRRRPLHRGGHQGGGGGERGREPGGYDDHDAGRDAGGGRAGGDADRRLGGATGDRHGADPRRDEEHRSGGAPEHGGHPADRAGG